MEEKRIYSVSPIMIDPGENRPWVLQPYGRQSAQHAHAVGVVWWRMGKAGLDRVPITTILLQCRDSKELCHIFRLLAKANIQKEAFFDRSEEAYGAGTPPIFTALATHPIEPCKVAGIMDYLPLLGGPQ